MSDRHKDRWLVVRQGGDTNFEIALVRASNEHGRRSMGWFHWDDKLLVARGGDKNYVHVVDGAIPALIRVARRLCGHLNAVERRANSKVRRKVPKITLGADT